MIVTSPASLTNQRLDAARQLLAQCERSGDDWMLSSFETSAIFQLRSALNGLLQEITLAYQLGDRIDLGDMAQMALKKEVVVPTLQELSVLESNRHSWLNQLYSAFQVALECRGASTAVDATALIGKGSDDAASTKLILNSLVELVLRFREDAAEY